MKRTWNGGVLTLATMLVSVLSAGCGGGDEESREDLVARANALRAQAVSQVATGTCDNDSQCTGLVFTPPVPSCVQHDQHTYSKRSAGAAAGEASAAEQRAVARLALAKATEPVVCTAHVEAPPRHVCVAQRCEQRPGSFTPD